MPEPTFRLDETRAQVLMDDLWVCGLRPTEGKGSAGALAATERHLKDLQKIVFERLGIDGAGTAKDPWELVVGIV